MIGLMGCQTLAASLICSTIISFSSGVLPYAHRLLDAAKHICLAMQVTLTPELDKQIDLSFAPVFPYFEMGIA